ncbi:MAG: class I SAM-dependent methyltransferase [Candidatus Adiutrix sp.]|jgi:SAM-dependent methyltransferase|nr:class I SAM-dependent methyltransferase [Candidatus Adiutrix sp.]
MNERDYHEYFIKDGRHVGRYEEMYRHCPDPWHIEALGARLDMAAALLLLTGRGGGVRRFLDIGAGLGLFTGLLTETLWRENPEARGLVTDVSPSAINRAAQRLADPRLDFMPLDARELPDSQDESLRDFDLIVMAQVLWGLLENLDETLAALAARLGPGGLLLISQHFPGAERQSYGAETVASPEDLALRLRRAGFEILNTLETNRSSNHHWAALAEKKK